MRDLLKKYATPLSLVIFAFVGVSGLMMFFGLRNHTLNELHEWVGVSFVAISVLHIVRNDRAFAFMIKQRRSIAVIAVLGLIGTAAIAMSFSTPSRGNPNRAMSTVVQQLANRPIQQISPAFGLSPDQMVAKLRAGGVIVQNSDQTLAELAPQAGMSPTQMFLLILPSQEKNGHGEHGYRAPPA